MNRNFNLKIALISLLAVVLLITISVDYTKDSTTDTPSTDIIIETNYWVKIKNGTVCLIKNNEIIKIYDIDITLLPGEDIQKLTDGIEVKNVAEADLLAEDFDG